MKQNETGSIVNISSTAGLNSSEWDAAIYTASEFAITGLTKAAAVKYGKYNIRVNTLHPGALNTTYVTRSRP